MGATQPHDQRSQSRARFGILGSLTAEVDGTRGLPAPQLRAPLAVLLLHHGQPVPDERLTALIFPGGAAESRGAYRTAMSRLRGWLGRRQAQLEHAGDGYQLAVPPGALDAARFEARCVEARCVEAGRIASGDPGDQDQLGLLGAALAEWRGEVLAGGPPELTGDPAAVALNLARAGCARQFGELALSSAQPGQALGPLTPLAGQYPYDEALQACFLRLLAAAGQPAQALRHYDALRRRLRDELGVEPSPQLQDVYLTLLGGKLQYGKPQYGNRQDSDPQPRPPRSSPPRSGSLRSRPAQVSRPPGEVRAPFQLPADLPDFVGRQDVVGAVLAALRAQPGGAYPAVVSVSGMPGVGKSSLAVHTAHLLRDRYPDGQIYLDLARAGAGAVGPHDGLGRVLLALGVAQQAQPASAADRAALLQSLTARRSLLLVLDNVAEAAQVTPLLPANPRCGVLATSRGVLSGLSAWPRVVVAPLEPAESLELLGRIVGPHRVAAEPAAGAQIAGVCAGLPLALRIAGTRIAARSHQSLGWFADRLGRDQTRLDELAFGGATIQDSFDLSYLGLSPAGQRALRLLALADVPDFAPWLAAAALGCGLTDAEDQIDTLVGAGLLTVAAAGLAGPPRFRFHQLTRLYAVSRAASEDTPAARDTAVSQACSAALALARQADQWLRHRIRPASQLRATDSGEPPGLPREVPPEGWLAAERGTLVALVRAATETSRPGLAGELALAMQRYLESQHHFSDWAHVVEVALTAARASQDRPAEAALLCSLGERYAVNDDHAAARVVFGQALASARECGQAVTEARALGGLSTGYLAGGELSQARDTAAAAVELIDPEADPGEAAEAQMSLGAALHLLGDYGPSEHWFGQALAGFERAKDLMNTSILLVNLGALYRDCGRFGRAEHALRRSAQICADIGFSNGMAFAYCGLGALLAQRGESAEAERVLLRALAIVREHTDLATEAKIRHRLGELFLARDPERAREHFARSADLATGLSLNGQLARALTGLGDAEQRTGNPIAAVAAWRDAQRLRHALDPGTAAGLRHRLGVGRARARA